MEWRSKCSSAATATRQSPTTAWSGHTIATTPRSPLPSIGQLCHARVCQDNRSFDSDSDSDSDSDPIRRRTVKRFTCSRKACACLAITLLLSTHRLVAPPLSSLSLCCNSWTRLVFVCLAQLGQLDLTLGQREALVIKAATTSGVARSQQLGS